jgi:hypothetical protein
MRRQQSGKEADFSTSGNHPVLQEKYRNTSQTELRVRCITVAMPWLKHFVLTDH